MGTKQLRISDADQIRKRSAECVGKQVSIVLRNNMVMSGKLTKAGSSEIRLQNMMLKETNYAFDVITELYFDSLT